MLPVSLESRAEEIFKEMGGLSAAKAYFKDEEITDICLFNGFTEILFPFYKPFTGSLSSGLYDYKSLDLSLINYESGSYVCVTNKDYKPLYNTTIVPEIIDGKLSYYFGKSENDRAFLQSCDDGELLYLLYQTASSPCLAQIIVSHKLPVSVIELNRNLWEAGLKSVSLERVSYGELIINNSLDTAITVFKLDGALGSNYAEADVAYNLAGVNYVVGGSSAYLKFTNSSWLCLREYSDYEEPDIYTISDQQELKELLETRDYNLITTTPQGYVMIKADGTDTYEISVIVEEDNKVDSVRSAKYKSLALGNIEGDNASYLTEINGVYHLDIKQTHVGGSDTKLITKTVFKVRADLNYV